MNRRQVVAVSLLVCTLASVTARQNHFGDPCYLCRCFVEYTDRDVAIPIRPYAMAADGYDSTEDRCLATCRRDEKCRAVVYGMVGGRKVFTCEFYERIDSRNSPIYSPFVNIYIKKGSCPLKDDIFESMEMIPADNSSLKRRLKQEKMANRSNPFEG
ncbi:Apple domain-containing protein [Trichostrongylus colubriformis]|uniref:Apple domain-containing protein n=1 Tax=Trichostrongylus colubriformis TaxID=6319 RepID=A0AAN8IND6_TRICO